jgi:hypothetical protein
MWPIVSPRCTKCSTKVTRLSGGSSAYAATVIGPRPGGRRTTDAVAGGVARRRNCGLSSRIAATVVSASRAMTSRPVMVGTTMESYASGSAGVTVKP